VAETVFLGLDVGTSGVKAILVAPSGDVVASATSPLTMATPHPGWAEQDPEAWWQASLASIAAVKAKRGDARIAAIGISGQMHSSVFLDRAGAVIRPALARPCLRRSVNPSVQACIGLAPAPPRRLRLTQRCTDRAPRTSDNSPAPARPL